MKKIVSIILAAVLVFVICAVAFAAAPVKIDGMAQDLSFGYSGDSDLGEVAPQDERVEYIELTDTMFTWDDGHEPSAPAPLTASQIRSAKLSVRASNHKVLDSVTINNSKSRIEIKFLNELVGVKGLDFDFDVILSVNGRPQRENAINFTGVFANPVMEVDANTSYADVSDGTVLKAAERVKDIDLDLGDGVHIRTKLIQGKSYYASATHIFDDGRDAVMSENKAVTEAIVLKTAGLTPSACTVTLGAGLNGYYVYSQDGIFLGRGSDSLAYADTYYLSKEMLGIPAETPPTTTDTVTAQKPDARPPCAKASEAGSGAASRTEDIYNNPKTGGGI